MMRYMILFRKLGAALEIMDMNGRSNEGDNSTMLWHDDWRLLRSLIWEVFDEMSENKETPPTNKP